MVAKPKPSTTIDFFPGNPMYCEGREKPMLRGCFHLTGLVFYLPFLILDYSISAETRVHNIAAFIYFAGNLFYIFNCYNPHSFISSSQRNSILFTHPFHTRYDMQLGRFCTFPLPLLGLADRN